MEGGQAPARRILIWGAHSLFVFLAVVVAFVINRMVAPRGDLVAAPFVAPILLAAYLLPTRGVVLTALLTFGFADLAAYEGGVPLVLMGVQFLGFFVSVILAIVIARQRRDLIRLARHSEESLQQAQHARATLDTILETVPIGVIMADPRGDIVYDNAAARAIVGGVMTGSAYEPPNGFAFFNRDGTPFPPRNLPLPRAIERGEATRGVEIWVRRDGVERVIRADGAPVREVGGRVTGAVAVFQDVTERMRTEEALRASEQSLARAQEVAHLGNWERDLRTGQLRWSDEIYRIFGIAPDEFGGTFEAFLDRVYPPDRAWVTKCLRDALTLGYPYSVDHRIVRPDGTIREVHEEAQVRCDAENRPVRLLGTVQDITERKRAEEDRERLLQQVQFEQARMEAIVNSSANAIIFIDARSKHIQANPAAVQLFGHPFVPDEGSGQYLPQLRHPDGQPVDLDALPSRHALEGQTISQEELIIVQPSGTRVPVLESAAPVRTPNGSVVGAVVVMQDITALKEVERLREEWTSVIAHDLRQPVTVIIGYATALLRPEAAPSNGQRPKIQHILTAAKNLNKMIADLLDVSRIESRRLVLQRQPVDLPSLVTAVVERTVGAEASPGPRPPIKVEIAEPIAPVLADPARIEQVLGNLLSNAEKYGWPDSEITVTLRQPDSVAMVAVTNRGPGIPTSEVAYLFTRYFRTHEARASRKEGLGLGLYITKKIVEAHQGEILVESTPGETTSFCFTLPLATVAAKTQD